MSLDEIKEVLGDNKLSYSTVSLSALRNIMMFVNVELQMDKHTFDYYYEMSVNDLVNSNMPQDELETLKKQGWSFSDDKKSLIVYLKNS